MKERLVFLVRGFFGFTAAGAVGHFALSTAIRSCCCVHWPFPAVREPGYAKSP